MKKNVMVALLPKVYVAVPSDRCFNVQCQIKKNMLVVTRCRLPVRHDGKHRHTAATLQWKAFE